jgi:uncharacterized membrane protein YdjX (TVP38/TMEM64 family)
MRTNHGSRERRSGRDWKLTVLVILFLAGVVLGLAGVVDWQKIRFQLEPVTDRWWLPPLLVAVQTVLFALALPGSALIPFTALLYPPLPTTLINVAGGVAGALAARHAVLKAGEGWERRLSRSPTYRLLERHCDVFTLCLLRILPGFPHSVINYGSGLLKVKTFPLVFATAVGFAIKGYLYAVTIYEAGKADEPTDLLRLDTLWPLLVVAGLLVAAHLFRRRWLGRTGS